MAFKNKQQGLSKSSGYTYEGKEIVLAKQQGAPVKTARNNKKWWPDSKKLESATLFAILRDSKKVSDLTSVPASVIDDWSMEPWFGEIIVKVKKERNEKLDAAITDVLSKGLEIVRDRFENGEIYIDKRTKQEYRVPVNVKNVAIVADIFFDKRQLIRGEATTLTSTITQEEKLQRLRDNFESLAKSKLINPTAEIIEGEAHELPETTSEAKAQETQGSGSSLDAVVPELRPELQAGSSDGIPGTEAPTGTPEQGS